LVGLVLGVGSCGRPPLGDAPGPGGTAPVVVVSPGNDAGGSGGGGGAPTSTGSGGAPSSDDGGTTAACGNGRLDPGEECDDGNSSDADACSSLCKEQRVSALAIGGDRTCAILSGGRVKCWGYVAYAELGYGDYKSRGDAPGEMGSTLPFVDLGAGRSAVAISLGYEHICALLDGGDVKCWGGNYFGELGLGDHDDRGGTPGQMGDALPKVDLGTDQTAVAISAGYGHSCALLTGGRVKCWGSNGVGELGLGDTVDRGGAPGQMGDALPAVDLGTGRTAVAISAGSASDAFYDHTCALLDDGQIKCWGSSSGGQLGLGDTMNRGDHPGQMGDALPAVDLGTGQTAVAVGYTCALLFGGSVKCWGDADVLGQGDMTSRGASPGQMGDNLPATDLGTGRKAVALASGYGTSCALLDDRALKCWGWNYDGQLGLGDTVNRGMKPGQMGDDLPAVDLGTGRRAAAVILGTAASAGDEHACAVLDDGSAKCWGVGGPLGLGDRQGHGAQPGQMGDDLPTVKLFSDVW